MLSILEWGQGKLIEHGSSMRDGMAIDQLVLQQGGNVMKFTAVVDVPNHSLALLKVDLIVTIESYRTNQLICNMLNHDQIFIKMKCSRSVCT